MPPSLQLQNCPIFLGPLAGAFLDWLGQQSYSNIIVLTDEHTTRDCLPYFLESSGLAGKIISIEIPPGELHKKLSTCEKIWQAMLEGKLDRRALMVNLGGGVIGDMGGFCAATWKRGIDFVQIPTTLLSMTDAAIGGKTGIDFQGVKNTIGVFQQPAAVFIDPAFLQTLPERELRSGYAEVIKHALIGDSAFRNQLSESFQLSESSADRWLELLQKSIAVKVRIVKEDPLEKGPRMLLNFGHSIGHALESWSMMSDDALSHGEAVYIGMVCEAFIYGKHSSRNLCAEVLALGDKIFPPYKIPQQALPAIWELMQQDKKNASGTVRLTVPDEKPYTMKVLTPARKDIERSLAFYNGLGKT